MKFQKAAATLLFLASLQQIHAFSTQHNNNQRRLIAKSSSSSSLTLLHSTSFALDRSINGESNAAEPAPIKSNTDHASAVIVGGGPAGLLSAIMYAQNFPDACKNKPIQVYDRLAAPPNPKDDDIWSDVAKFYLIGLGGRGQKALAKYGVWKDVKDVCTSVVGRKDWAPDASPEEGVERVFTDRPYTTEVLPRDKLVGVLHGYICKKLSDKVELNYGYDVFPEDFGDKEKPVVVRISKCESISSNRKRPTTASVSTATAQEEVLCDVDESSFTLSTELLIAADGTSRTVANQMESDDKTARAAMNPVRRLFAKNGFRVTRYEDDNQRIYKTIPLALPENWRHDLNYSARTNRFNIDALPADDKGNYCGVLLLKNGDALAEADTDTKELRAFFDKSLPQFGALIDEQQMEQIAIKPPSYLPSFRYVGPRLNQGDRTVIIGDCAHTVKPYFGLGANSALEDVSVLGDVLKETSDTSKAVHEYTKRRAKEAEVLVKISRGLDRPGLLGFATFVFPLILDSIFNKLAPKLFAPNIISMLQRDGLTFRDVQNRKRMDRAGQVVILGTGFYGVSVAAKTLIRALARTTGRGNATIACGLMAIAALPAVLKKALFYLNPNLAPADVLGKTKSKVVAGEEEGESGTGEKTTAHSNKEGVFFFPKWFRVKDEQASDKKKSTSAVS